MMQVDGIGMCGRHILFKVSSKCSLIGFAINIGLCPWQWAKWVSKNILHINIPAFSHKDPVVAQISISLRNNILTFLSMRSFYVNIVECFEALFGHLVKEF